MPVARVLAAVLLLAVVGCVRGLLYTHTVIPLSADLHRTPVASHAGARSALVQLRYSWLDLRSGSNAIGEIAAQHGLREIYYADLEQIRVLNIWNRTYVRVYGALAAP